MHINLIQPSFDVKLVLVFLNKRVRGRARVFDESGPF